MITIYAHGCANCGVNAVFIRQIKAYAKENDVMVEVKNSKYEEGIRLEHLNWLSSAGLAADNYQPIVVEGNNVKGLRQWRV